MEKQKEMNLFDLCAALVRGIGSGLRWLLQLIGKMIRLTYRQWWIVLIVVLLSCVAALYVSRKDNRMYEVNAVAVLNGATKDVVSREYLALNHTDKDFEQQNLESMLGIAPEVAASISHFATYDVIDLMGDSTIDVIDYECKMPTMDTLYVHVPYMLALQYRTKLPNTTQQVEEGILNYLNTRKSIQTPYAQFYTNLQRAVTFHHDQLEKLDSLTSAFYFTNNHLPQVGSDIWHSGMVLGSREIDLFLEEINTEMEVLQFTDMRFAFADAPVVLQSPFVVDTRAINGPIKCLALGIILGWLLGVIVASLVDNRKGIAIWLKEK